MSPSTIRGWLPALLGAAVGGGLGYLAFFWLAQQGLYALVLPGALLGIGFGYFIGRPSIAGAVLCGVLGLALGIVTEWRFAPFKADPSLQVFLVHLFNLKSATLLMLAVGAAFAAWFGRGRAS